MPAGTVVGSIYAEAELNIDKFKAAAAQMGTDASRIVSAMDKAGAGLEKAQANLDGLKASLDAANIQADAAKAAWQSSAQALQEMQEKAEAAAIKAADLGKIYEDTAQKFGEGSAAAYMASRDYDDAAKTADELADAVDNQQAKVLKSQAAFKKAEAAVRKYSGQISTAESDIKKFNDQIAGMNRSLEEAVLEDYTGDVDSASMSTEAFNDILDALEKKGLRGIGSAVESSVGQLSLFKNATGIAGVGLTAIQRGLTSVIGALSPATVGVVALTAAAGYGAYKFYDYASGAAAAREALEKLNTTAQEWQETNATTRFEQSAGLKAFGLSEDDFAPAVSNSKDWLNTLVKVWTDGKVETDDIVREMVDGFTVNTDTLRTRMEELQTQAQKAGVSGTGLFGDMEADLARLDELDAQVEALLKKRQNGFLTDEEISALQSMIDERGAIEVKYHLVEDQTSGFDEIVQGVQAAVSRGAASTEVWADAYASATQGVQAYNDALNSEYDAQYKVISMIEDSSQREAALSQLQLWHSEQARAGAEAYYNTLKETAQQTNMFSLGGDYNETIAQMDRIVSLMNQGAGEGTIATELAKLDETQVVELSAAFAAMQSAASQAGVEMDSSFTDAMASLQTLISLANGGGDFEFSDSLTQSIEDMFGEGLKNEVLEIDASLNTETLTQVYDAWAAGEHADIIPTVEYDGSNAIIDTPEPIEVLIREYKAAQDVGMPPNPEVEATISDYEKNGSVTTVSWLASASAIVEFYEDSPDLTYDSDKLKELTAYISKYDASAAELPTVVVPAVMDFQNQTFSASSDTKGDFYFAQMQVDQQEWSTFADSGRQIIDAVNNYITAKQMYDKEMAAGDENTALQFQKVMQLNAQALNGFVQDSEGFGTVAAFVANGLDLLSSGNLTKEDAESLAQFTTGLQTMLSTMDSSQLELYGLPDSLKEQLAAAFSADNIGWESTAGTILGDLTNAITASSDSFAQVGISVAQGYASGMTQDTTSISDASNAVADYTYSALASAVDMGSPAGLTKPVGTSVTEGVGEGMKDTSSIDAAGVVVSEAAADALLARIESAYSIGVNFDAGFARGILGGKSRVISAAANVASAALSAAKAKLQIASPSKVTEEFGEYFDLGFIEGIANMAPRIDDAVERAISIDPPAWVTNGQAYAQEPSAMVMSSPIDYDRIAQAIRDGGMTMECDGKKFAEITTDDTARAQNNRSRRMAIGYGKR